METPALTKDDYDTDTWCTPRRWARALGPWDLDPCSNPRSHIVSARRFMLEHGQCGIALAPFVPPGTRTFINAPFSRGMMQRFVDAYKHTRFCFLCRVDPSTSWWETLWPFVGLFCLPSSRIEFEPPPGVENPGVRFPHALLYARAEDATPAVLRMCYATTPN